MRMFKNMAMIMALLLTVTLLADSAQASAGYKKGKLEANGSVGGYRYNGSTERREYHWKAKYGEGAIEAWAVMSPGYVADTMQTITVRYVYRNKTKLRTSSGKRMTYRQYYGKGRPNRLNVRFQATVKNPVTRGTALIVMNKRIKGALTPNRARTVRFAFKVPCYDKTLATEDDWPWFFPSYPRHPTPGMMASWQCMPINEILIDMTAKRMGSQDATDGIVDKGITQDLGHVWPGPLGFTVPPANPDFYRLD